MWEREHVITCDLKKSSIRLYSILCKNYPFEMRCLSGEMLFFTVHCKASALSWRTSVKQLVTGILAAFELLSRAVVTASDRPCACERFWMRAVARPHTPSLSPSFRSRQTVALETQRAPVRWEWKFFQLYLFICLISFPLSVARIEQTRRLSCVRLSFFLNLALSWCVCIKMLNTNAEASTLDLTLFFGTSNAILLKKQFTQKQKFKSELSL